MKNKKSILIGGLLVALLVAGVIGATSVYAQTPSNVPLQGRGPGGGDGPRADWAWMLPRKPWA